MKRLLSSATMLLAAILTVAAGPRFGTAGPDAPMILYDDALTINGLEQLVKLRAQRYILMYQNNCDPEAQKTGVINPGNIANALLKTEGDQPQGWGVLDFETPFDEMILKGPESPERDRAVATMVAAIERVKRLFPKVRWTYYGIPALSYYIDGKDWSNAPASEKEREVRKQIAQYGPVLAACDWLAPCVYVTVGDSKLGGRPNPLQRLATRSWVEARTRMCVEFARNRSEPVPVIPFVSPLYMPGGGARAFSVIASDILNEDVLQPAMKAGASGITIWTSGGYFVQQATSESPDASFVEGGGRKTLVSHWAQDLNKTTTSIETAEAAPELRAMIANGIVRCAQSAEKIWSDLHPAPPTKAVNTP
jgi:hypothetical protein